MAAAISGEIKKKYEEWLSLDKNEQTKSEIQRLLESGNVDELKARLCHRMTFGTAGLRAKLGAGYNRMNDLTIIQTTQGLSYYIEEQFGSQSCSERGVVIGYDARYGSQRFAQLTASVFANKGFKVYLFSKIVPTPFTAYAVIKFKCVAGVMVTASHNPKEDNGYKVYWSNGAQIISPHDKGISRSIKHNLIPWPTSWNTDVISNSTSISDPFQEISDSYNESILKYCYRKSVNGNSKARFVYTAMHGVGWPFMEAAFKTFGLAELVPVIEQVMPDPEFPTVRYPNPEEGKAALNLAIATADRSNCQLIIANDPDADRLALAEKQRDGTWKVFNGNEIGDILAWWAFTNYKKKNPTFDGEKVHMIASAVSSKLLRSMAKVEGFQFNETLTGFKWMGNKAFELLQDGHEVLFAFEEAIGFMFGTTVLDKDGISAGVAIAEVGGYLYDSNRTFTDLLEDIYTKYGHFLSNNSYYICHSSQVIKDLFDSLRKDRKYPEKCGDAKVVWVCDLTVGYDSRKPPDYKPVLPVDPHSQMIQFGLDNQCEFTLRTSGTEPKIKYYVELCTLPGNKISFVSLKNTLDQIVDSVVKDFLRPDLFPLSPRSPH